MIDEVKTYDSYKLMGVSRAFAHFLALSNQAENVHRIRRNNERLVNSPYGLAAKIESCGGCIHHLLKEGHSKEQVYDALCSQSVEIVLTGMVPTHI